MRPLAASLAGLLAAVCTKVNTGVGQTSLPKGGHRPSLENDAVPRILSRFSWVNPRKPAEVDPQSAIGIERGRDLAGVRDLIICVTSFFTPRDDWLASQSPSREALQRGDRFGAAVSRISWIAPRNPA
jgi:hypothetical protein